MKQISFEFAKIYKKDFGGSKLVGIRKSKRPISTTSPMHLTLKSNEEAIFLPSDFSLQSLISDIALRFHVRVYDFAINWSHIHFVIKVNSRENYNAFIRALTSLITAKVQKSHPHLEKIFTLRPHTRILHWGRDFENALNYIQLNQMEARGLIHRKKKAKPLCKASLSDAHSVGAIAGGEMLS